MRRFSLYKRGKYFYVQFFNEKTGKYLSGRSTGQTSRNAAVAAVLEWDTTDNTAELARAESINTIIETIKITDLRPADIDKITAALNNKGARLSAHSSNDSSSENLVSFLQRFWNYDESPYVAEKNAHGQAIGRRRCNDMSYAVNGHWKRRFPDISLGDITRRDLTEFGIDLSKLGLAAKTINHVIQAGTVALSWAFANELIPANPAAHLRKFSGRSEKRGVLSISEAKALFALRWEDERARTANLVAATTGLRAGEIAALRLQDIGVKTVSVVHAWSNDDRLKAPKNGEQRTVPLLAAVRRSLLSLVSANPWQSDPEAWVMWSTRNPDRPVDPQHFYRELIKTLPRLRVSQSEYENVSVRRRERDYWRERKIVFHSWRHFYAARMADRIDKHKVMQATGHRSESVFDVYADHVTDETMEEVATVTVQAFGELLPTFGEST
ncbi:MAG: site-specific integrase [Alkalispirochaeta sp.]